MADSNYEYDVCLSFAGEDREPAERTAEGLRDKGIRVFYDKYEVAELWGKDLYEHLDFVYREAARFCVLFISEHYAEKVWTNHERRSAQARAIEENREYILPIRLDDTKVPGLRDTIGYVDLREVSEAEVVDLIEAKLGPRQRVEFMPPVLDRLYEALEIDDEAAKEMAEAHARTFFHTLRRMSSDERVIVATVFQSGCPGEMPENMHMSLDRMRRQLGRPVSQIIETLSGIGSLGFSFNVRESHDSPDELASDGPLAVLSWSNRTIGDEEGFDGEPMVVADTMFDIVRESYCEEHGVQAIENLDFGSLAAVTDDHDQDHDDDEDSPTLATDES